MYKIAIFLVIFTLFKCKSTQHSGSSATLENTYWKLVELNGKPLITPADAKDVHMILTSIDGVKNVKGYAGCNTIGGNFTLDGIKIHFTIVSTKMFCQDRMDVEEYFTIALSKAETYLIKDDTLNLYQGETNLLSLKAVHIK